MPEPSFNEIWDRIVKYSGETFITITGLEFTYEIKNNGFYPSRTKYRISKENFRKVYQMIPVDGPGMISKEVRGPSYVWAVLYDPRISLREW
jgi:hypothetical protein